jgi:RNA polymerase sigma-70 factor (sigma-E family)
VTSAAPTAGSRLGQSSSTDVICHSEHIHKHLFDGGSARESRDKHIFEACDLEPDLEPKALLKRGAYVTGGDIACDVDTPGADVTWSEVYKHERDGLVRLAYLITGSQAVAEDLVHDTFLKVMAKLDAGSEPGAYLRRSVINACYSWHRRSWREVALTSDNPYGAQGVGQETEMWDALSRLPTRRRTVLVLRYYLDLSEAEVASMLGCRVGTVKSTSHRALKDLRRMLEG